MGTLLEHNQTISRGEITTAPDHDSARARKSQGDEHPSAAAPELLSTTADATALSAAGQSLPAKLDTGVSSSSTRSPPGFTLDSIFGEGDYQHFDGLID